MRKKYASDISREKFEEILPLLQSVRRRTKPTTVDLYEVFCAVLYLLRSGCQWRMLPSDFPKWRTVHSYFAKWSEPDQHGSSVLELKLKLVLTRFHGHMRALGFRPEWGGVWGDYRQCMPAQRVRSSR